MATITNQTAIVKTIADIYNINPNYTPTKDTLLLMSTLSGTTVSSKSCDLLLSPKIFSSKLNNLYCKDDNALKYKDLIPLKG